jgi:hypothetical protein
MTEDFYWCADRILPRLQEVNGSTSKQRSERREAIVGVVQVLIYYCDLATLHVGTLWKKKTGINYLRTGFIATALKFGFKRVQRALKDLEKAKYIQIKRKVINKHNNLYQANEISLTRRLFLDLGMTNLSLEMSRHYKHKSNVKRGIVIKELTKAAAGAIKSPTPGFDALPEEIQEKGNKVTNAKECLRFLRTLRAHQRAS